MYPKIKKLYIDITMEIYTEWRTLKFSLKLSQRSKIKNRSRIVKNENINVNKTRSVAQCCVVKIFKNESRNLHSKACRECKLPSMAITTMHPRLLGSEKSSAIPIVTVLNSYKIPSTLQQPAEILPEYSLSFFPSAITLP